MPPRKLLIVDDHAMIREGVRLLFGQQQLEVELVEAGSLAEGLRRLAEPHAFDWVLLDLGLPDAGGLTALDRLREAHAEVPIVVLSASEERSLVLECINRGAMGFVGKSSTGAGLVEALRLVFAGGIHLPPAVFGHPASRDAAPRSSAPAGREAMARLGLTPRQSEVLELLVQGLTNKHIATRLGLSEATVKTHVAASLRALNVRNRTQAVFALARLHAGNSLVTGP